MKLNRILSVVISASTLALTACSTTSWNPNDVSTPDHQNIRLDKASRDPAGEPQVYWKKESRSFDVSSSGTHQTFSVDVNQVKEWEEDVPYTDTCFDTRPVEVPATCEGYRCTGSGTGSSEAWNAFYSAPKAQKPAALANAIKGVGIPTATKLVDGGYFNRKPRSWSDFTSELQRAANNGTIGNDIVYNATVKYKAENVANLGYDLGSCSVYTYDCTSYEDRVVSYPCTKYRTETRTRTIDTVTRPITLSVTAGTLQSFETDRVSVTVGHDSNDVSVEAGPYNRYNAAVSAQGNSASVTVTPVQRILVDLPRSAMRQGKLEPRPGSLMFGVKVDPNYIGKEGNDQLVLRYNVYTCKANFLNRCLGSSKPGTDVTVPLTQGETMIPITIPKKMRAKVVYSIARKNSKYYNDNFLSNFETDTEGPK